MKHTTKFKCATWLFCLLSICGAPLLCAQNWPTFGGDNARSGHTKIAGPESVGAPKWTVTNSASTSLGNAVYTFGDRFVTSRVTFSPYKGNIECRSLQTGALLWTSPFISPTSILYAAGFTPDAVYAHDYATDTIFALRPDNGQVKWRSSIRSHTFGAYPGFVFACNGDPIVNGPVSQGIFTMRLDKHTGAPLWTNSTLIAIGPTAVLASRADRVYRITGGITIPIVLTAIDANTGVSLYHSAPLPGDADQENPMALGDAGEIYFWRDGGKLHAFNDTGSGFEELWTFTPATTTGAATTGNISLGWNGDLYVFDDARVKRIRRQDGTVTDTSLQLNLSQPSLTVDGDSTVIVNTGTGQFLALSPDLQTIKWQLAAANNVYCNPAPAKDGILVITRSGAQIRAFQSVQSRPPVADFASSATRIGAGQPLAFADQSSYLPDGWHWTFEGGTPASSTEAAPVVTYAEPGVYDVGLVVENAQGTDTLVKTCYLEVVPAVSTGTPEEILPVQVFPNPAAERLSVRLPERVERLAYRLVDARGSVVLAGVFSGDQAELDLSRVAAGVYQLVLTGERGQWVARVAHN